MTEEKTEERLVQALVAINSNILWCMLIAFSITLGIAMYTNSVLEKSLNAIQKSLETKNK